MAKVLKLGITLTAHLGTYSSVVITEHTSRLEPTAIEHKKDAPGVGLVAEQATDANGVLQLIQLDPKGGTGPSTEGPLRRV